MLKIHLLAASLTSLLLCFPTLAGPKQDSIKELQSKIQWLDEVEKTLSYKYVGWEDQIHRMMSAARTIELNPELVNRPFVIPIFTMPGAGKTSLIQDFVRLMGWSGKFRQTTLRDGAEAVPITPLVDMAKKERSSPGLQGVYLVDEFQKLKKKEPPKHFVPDPKNPAPPQPSAEELKNKTEMGRLWDVLGNGTFVEPTQYSFDQYISFLQAVKQQAGAYDKSITQYQTAIQQSQAQIDALKLQMTGPEGTINPNIEAQIKSFEAQIANYKTQIESYVQAKQSIIETTGANYINQIIADRYDAFSYRPGMTAEQLAKELGEDPDKFIAEFRKAYAQIPPDPFVDVKRSIIVVTGNPDELLEPAITAFHAGREHGPDQLRNIIENIPPEKMRKFFKDRMGTESGWESRFQLEDWKIGLPLSSSEWKTLASRTLDNFGSSFVANLKRHGRPVQIAFDESVLKMIYDATVDPLGGPRVMVTNTSQIVGSFFTELQSKLARMKKKEMPGKIVVSFDAATSSIIARPATEEAGKALELASRISLPKKLAPMLMEQSWETRRRAYHIAGHTVVGMEAFGSVPEEATLRLTTSEVARSGLWKHPGDLHGYKLNQVKMLLGGGIAQDWPSATGYMLPETQENVQQAQTILRELAEDSRDRQNLLSLAKMGKKGKASGSQGATMTSQEIERLAKLPDADLFAGGEKSVQDLMASSYVEAKEILERHRPLVEAIAAKLEQSGSISGSELKNLAALHPEGFLPKLRDKLAANVPGKVDIACVTHSLSVAGNAEILGVEPAAVKGVSSTGGAGGEGFFVPLLKQLFGEP